MFSRDTWKEIFETIRKNKLRTFLSGFTVALGILIFVILYGFGNGLQNTFAQFFGVDATNVMYFFPGRTAEPYGGFKANRRIEFNNSDLAEIESRFESMIEYTTPRIGRPALVRYQSESNNYNTRAVAPGNQFAEKTIMMKGRYLNTRDIENKTKYAVIGRLVEQDLFEGENSIGKYIDLGGSVFKVIGVFQDDGGDDEERVIFIPYTTRQLIEKNTDKIDLFLVAFNPELGYIGGLALQNNIEKLLRERKKIAPNDQNAMFVRNISEELQVRQGFGRVLQIIVGFVALGTIIAGVIGISNIMVFVVKERTKELGIRKALGATPNNVVGTILLESVFITTVSGFSGMIIGIIILNSLAGDLDAYFIKDPYINISTAIFATLLLILFGAIAGYVPANRAARIKPIVALRDE